MRDLANDNLSLESDIFRSPILDNGSEQKSHENSIQGLSKEIILGGAELVVTVNPIGGEDNGKPAIRHKSPIKRPHSAPTEAGSHKKKKTTGKVLFAAGTDPPGDRLDLDLPDPKDPGGVPPGYPRGPSGGGDPPPDLPLDPPEAPTPRKPKMGANKLAMKDIPLYKEREDPIAFITSFMSYLNYYDIDPTIIIPKEGEPQFVDAEMSAKAMKRHYRDPKILLGRALQG